MLEKLERYIFEYIILFFFLLKSRSNDLKKTGRTLGFGAIQTKRQQPLAASEVPLATCQPGFTRDTRADTEQAWVEACFDNWTGARSCSCRPAAKVDVESKSVLAYINVQF